MMSYGIDSVSGGALRVVNVRPDHPGVVAGQPGQPRVVDGHVQYLSYINNDSGKVPNAPTNLLAPCLLSGITFKNFSDHPRVCFVEGSVKGLDLTEDIRDAEGSQPTFASIYVGQGVPPLSADNAFNTDATTGSSHAYFPLSLTGAARQSGVNVDLMYTPYFAISSAGVVPMSEMKSLSQRRQGSCVAFKAFLGQSGSIALAVMSIVLMGVFLESASSLPMSELQFILAALVLVASLISYRALSAAVEYGAAHRLHDYKVPVPLVSYDKCLDAMQVETRKRMRVAYAQGTDCRDELAMLVQQATARSQLEQLIDQSVHRQKEYHRLVAPLLFAAEATMFSASAAIVFSLRLASVPVRFIASSVTCHLLILGIIVSVLLTCFQVLMICSIAMKLQAADDGLLRCNPYKLVLFGTPGVMDSLESLRRYAGMMPCISDHRIAEQMIESAAAANQGRSSARSSQTNSSQAQPAPSAGLYPILPPLQFEGDFRPVGAQAQPAPSAGLYPILTARQFEGDSRPVGAQAQPASSAGLYPSLPARQSEGDSQPVGPQVQPTPAVSLYPSLPALQFEGDFRTLVTGPRVQCVLESPNLIDL